METVKNYCQKHFKRAIFLVILPILGMFLAGLFSSQVFATSETLNLQGKIVRNDTGNEGLNVSAGSPSCVFLGASNDTCDFRVKYYSVDTLGTLLASEVFSNIEIGEYNGIFNLALGTGTFTAGTESTFRGIFLNNTAVYVEMDFAPDGTTYTETFLNPDGKRMAVRAAPYAISAGGASKQFQFDNANDETGYSNIAAGQVFYDGNDNVLRLYDGTNWLAVQASIGNLPSYWLLNEAADPDIIYSYTGLDVAFGGTDSSSPFFYDVSGQLLTLTNTGTGLSFRVNDQAGDASPFAIDASGNVGIGTDAPSAKLEVTGGRAILKSLGESQTLGIGRTDGAGLYWLGVNASSTPALSFLNNGGTERFRINDNGGLVQIGANDTALGLSLQKATVDATHIEWRLFNASNNKDMTISGYNGTNAYTFVNFDWDNLVTNFETGRVGIGVASPNAFFGIKAATTSSAQINLVSSAGVNPATPVNGDLWWNGTNLYFFDGSSSVDLLAGGGGGGSLFTDGGAITYLTSVTDNFALGGSTSTSPFYFDATGQLLTLTNTTSGLSFRVNDEASDTTPFVIDADGNVGIGTATPGGKLEIAGVSSVISNTAGDITIDSYSGLISFAGDSISNVLNGTFSGNVVLNGGQLQFANHSSNPTSIGEGSVVYNTTEKKLYYYKDTGWSEVGKVYSGTTGQTLRHNGTDWVANSVLVNDGTNVTVNGQLRVGNYGSKPSGIGAGSLVYDTTLGSLFVYDGTDWKAISTSQLHSATGIVSDGSYLELVHNENSFDLISNAWVKVGSQWKPAQNTSNDFTHALSNQWDKADSNGVKRVDSRLTNLELAPGLDVGTGADGSITISGNTNINTQNSISGRSCVDGGDAVNYSVTTLTSNTAVLSTTPSSGCLNVGDEILLINLQGTYTSMDNVGNYETLRIDSISTNTVTFKTPKTKYYGDNFADDSNLGTSTSNQRVMLQRVPNYINVTINSSISFTPSAWDGIKGGVMFFRSSGTVTVNGSLQANATGYKGATTRGAYGGGDNNGRSGGAGGEAYCGPGGTGGAYLGNGGNGAAGGGSGQTATGGAGYCGGGGGGTVAGTGSSTKGGAGGGGNGYNGAGGGAGYGTAGAGGASNGVSGGVNSSGNGGAVAGVGGGGGGGTYGDANLTKLMFGSGGGKGVDYEVAGDYLGDGGNGGGIVAIFSETLTVNGTLQSNGGSGENNLGGTYGGGGGGGAGGSMLIAGATVNVGSSLTTVSGGGGGTGQQYNGGSGGSGRIAVYYQSTYTGTSGSPSVTNTYSVGFNNYGVYHSPVISTPNAFGYHNIRWEQYLDTHGKISVQTRSGMTDDPTDGSWEGWKPYTITDNYISLEDSNTHTNWVGSNATVVEGDVTRNIDYFEDEDEVDQSNLTKITSSTAGGYVESTISAEDLSGYDYITVWVRSSQTGNVLKLGIGESSGDEEEFNITIDESDVWQKVYWDISQMTATNIDAVTKLRLTNNPSVSNTIYVDNMKAEKLISNSNGSFIETTGDDYFQYRVVFTTRNTSYRPILYNIKFTWDSGYKIDLYDANTIRLYNNSGKEQELRVTASSSGGSAGGGSNWVSAGGNVYRASGNVGIGDTTPDVELKVVGALCVRANADDCAGATAGTIYANNTSVQSADLAEMYRVSDLSIDSGDIVSLDPNALGEVQKSDLDNIENVMGVVSTAPGLLMNDSNDENMRPIGLIGKLPVKVMATGRSIVKGDAITASSLSGIGVVREDSGMVVAKTLEETIPWNDESCEVVDSYNDIVWPEDRGQNESKPCFKVSVDSFDASTREELMNNYHLSLSGSIYIGKVMAFVDVVWYQPQWLADDLSALASDYKKGLLGGNGGGWKIEEDLIKTDKEVSVNNLYGTAATFNILTAGLLNVGDGSLVADSGGNLSIAGDLLIRGRIKSPNGSLVLEIGSGIGDLFAINNSDGEVVFSVDSAGKVGGKGVYRSEWVKVEANSSALVYHNLREAPSSISIIKADNSQGYGFTSKGLGTDYYFEHNDNDSVKVYNKTNQAIYVKLTVQK